MTLLSIASEVGNDQPVERLDPFAELGSGGYASLVDVLIAPVSYSSTSFSASMSHGGCRPLFGKRCAAPVVSSLTCFGHANLQVSLREICSGAPN